MDLLHLRVNVPWAFDGFLSTPRLSNPGSLLYETLPLYYSSSTTLVSTIKILTLPFL